MMKFKKYYNIKLNKFKIILYIYIMSKKSKSFSETRDDKFRSLLNAYKKSVFVVSSNLELEVRFGTKGLYKPITKIDYNNVLQRLLSRGFKLKTNDQYLLRIQNEYFDEREQKHKLSVIRCELTGLSVIQNYCKTNRPPENSLFYKKSYFKKEDKLIYPVDFNDFNLRISLQEEKSIPNQTNIVRKILDTWERSKKVFRLINRVSLIHPDLPMQVDMSIVKTSKKKFKNYIPEYTIQESNLFNNYESYEIEIEILNKKITSKEMVHLENNIFKVSKFILSGLQETNYPISTDEMNDVLENYLKLIKNDDKYKFDGKVKPKDFIGYSSITLQHENIRPVSEESTVPSLLTDYTVTEKADGLRKLLYIYKSRIYLIDTNMNIQYTGTVSLNKDLNNTILDGEHILHNKENNFINYFMAFDIYFLNKKDIRRLSLIPFVEKDKPRPDSRYELLRFAINNLQMETFNMKTINSKNQPFVVKYKTFHMSNNGQSIFSACNNILQQHDDGLFPYETDGLIFTPAYDPAPSETFKTTWDKSFKWKPPKFNTIDFLVTVNKTKLNEDDIGNIFNSGIGTNQKENFKQFKKVTLRVGFDQRKHGYINPFAEMIENKMLNQYGVRDDYKPIPFIPTSPYDPTAYLCFIPITLDKNGFKQMFTEENEVIEDHCIVEFSYDKTRENHFKWVPLRVRYDKTAEYRRGLKNFGNSYLVANSNWYSIHNPITALMIRTGNGIPIDTGNDDIYYNKESGQSLTTPLRHFHNLFVKRSLLQSVCRPNDKLIDFAIGKGGDIQKFIENNLKFVYGIDISRDNIHNRLDGACARYLSKKKTNKNLFKAVFLPGDSSKNIKLGNSFDNEKNRNINNAIQGIGQKDKQLLGDHIYNMYGIVKGGFNVGSIQFAIHYMFQSNQSLHEFLRNVSDHIQVGGYFVGTTYDGERVFNYLQGLEKGESKILMLKNKKIWEIKKQYDVDVFEPNDSSIGYAIDVYQETINKYFREYLVNFKYLTKMMEDYGFIALPKDEAIKIGLTDGIDSFKALFTKMELLIKSDRKHTTSLGDSFKMTPEEKTISFLNNYFVFKKIRNIDTLQMFNMHTKTKPTIDDVVIYKPKKLNRKIKLVD